MAVSARRRRKSLTVATLPNGIVPIWSSLPCSYNLSSFCTKSSSVEDQRKIWRVLNRLNDVGLTDGEIDAIVEKHHDLSGRDIKQVLKLSSLWAQDKGERVDATTVEFARTFLPTGTV